MFVDSSNITTATGTPVVQQQMVIANSANNNTVVTTTTHNQQQQQHGLAADYISAAELQRQEGSTEQIVNISSKVNEKICFHINSLPTEVLSKIFLRVSYEERICAERVCRLWFHIIRSHICWTDLHRLKVKIASLDQAHSILKRVGPYLHEFWLESEEWDLSAPLELYQHLACLTPNLRHFALFSERELDDVRHINASGLAKNLISLAISCERETNSRRCFSLIQTCSKLENLYLSVISYGDPVKKLPSTLKYLAIGPAHRSRQQLIIQLLTIAVRNCPNLCALSMPLKSGEEKQAELIPKFKKLKWLQINNEIDSNVLGHLLQHKFRFATLQYLSITYIQDSNDESFRLLCRECTQLEIFDFSFKPNHVSKLEPLQEFSKLRQLRHLRMFISEIQQPDGSLNGIDEEDIKGVQHILEAIAAHGKLEVLLINGVNLKGVNLTSKYVISGMDLGPAEHVVNSLIRPCKSISLFKYSDFDSKEANAFCTLIEQLVVEEEEQNELIDEFTGLSYNGDDKANNKRRRRNLPIHVVLNKDLAQNAALPRSEFVCWHASGSEARKIVDQNMHEILGWTKSVPRFMFDDDYFLARDVNDLRNNTLLL